jgi:DNA-binding XRE family transcriptional regulator
MSRLDLARLIGVNYQTVGYLERGDYSPSLELALRMSEVFGLPVEAIFFGPPVAATSSPSCGALRSSPSDGSTSGPSFIRCRAGSSMSRSGPNRSIFRVHAPRTLSSRVGVFISSPNGVVPPLRSSRDLHWVVQYSTPHT